MDPSKTAPIPKNVTPGPGRHLHGRDLNQRFRQHGINSALKSVNL
uniref:Transposase n=1 Tax=Bursaphelenchus xylophilus TaxID=6326 RepID=A0A1I7SNR0_BURXY